MARWPVKVLQVEPWEEAQRSPGCGLDAGTGGYSRPGGQQGPGQHPVSMLCWACPGCKLPRGQLSLGMRGMTPWRVRLVTQVGHGHRAVLVLGVWPLADPSPPGLSGVRGLALVTPAPRGLGPGPACMPSSLPQALVPQHPDLFTCLPLRTHLCAAQHQESRQGLRPGRDSSSVP